MEHNRLGRKIVVGGVLGVLVMLVIVSAVGLAVGTRYEVAPPFSAVDRNEDWRNPTSTAPSRSR